MLFCYDRILTAYAGNELKKKNKPILILQEFLVADISREKYRFLSPLFDFILIFESPLLQKFRNKTHLSNARSDTISFSACINSNDISLRSRDPDSNRVCACNFTCHAHIHLRTRAENGQGHRIDARRRIARKQFFDIFQSVSS